MRRNSNVYWPTSAAPLPPTATNITNPKTQLQQKHITQTEEAKPTIALRTTAITNNDKNSKNSTSNNKRTSNNDKKNRNNMNKNASNNRNNNAIN